MYIIKNALKCIGRSKSRNVLIGIIALVIAISACIGLSIRQAAENARETAMDNMSITATISYDRGAMMNEIGGGGKPQDMPGGFGNFGGFGDMMNDATEYISEIDNAMNLTVVFQMLGVGILLTLIASAASVLFIMRYDPLKILANRD